MLDIVSGNDGRTFQEPMLLTPALHCPPPQNVKPEKLFSRERAVQQLLGLIDRAQIEDSGAYWAWDGQTIPW